MHGQCTFGSRIDTLMERNELEIFRSRTTKFERGSSEQCSDTRNANSARLANMPALTQTLRRVWQHESDGIKCFVHVCWNASSNLVYDPATSNDHLVNTAEPGRLLAPLFKSYKHSMFLALHDDHRCQGQQSYLTSNQQHSMLLDTRIANERSPANLQHVPCSKSIISFMIDRSLELLPT